MIIFSVTEELQWESKLGKICAKKSDGYKTFLFLLRCLLSKQKHTIRLIEKKNKKKLATAWQQTF